MFLVKGGSSRDEVARDRELGEGTISEGIKLSASLSYAKERGGKGIFK